MKVQVIYINAKYGNKTETVDQFPYNNLLDRQYANLMLEEYRTSDRYNRYYLSQRCTNEWKE